MRSSLAKLAVFSLCVGLACAAPQLLAKKKDKDAAPAANEQKRALHALNRLTFGPRPGDLQQVMAMGVDRWVALQLHPEKISDAMLESRLAPFRTLRMSPREMVEEFPDGQLIKQVMDGKKSMPSDPARRAVFQVQIARLEEKREQKQEEKRAEATPPKFNPAPRREPDQRAAADTAKTAEEIAAAAAASPEQAGNTNLDGNSMTPMPASNRVPADEASMTPPEKANPASDREARRLEDRLYADLEVQKLADLPPDQRYKKVLSMSPDQQVAFADALRGGKGQEFLAGLEPKPKETLQATAVVTSPSRLSTRSSCACDIASTNRALSSSGSFP